MTLGLYCELVGINVVAGEPRANSRVLRMSFVWKYAEDIAVETPEIVTNSPPISRPDHLLGMMVLEDGAL